jgi:hypothetical protein
VAVNGAAIAFKVISLNPVDEFTSGKYTIGNIGTMELWNDGLKENGI